MNALRPILLGTIGAIGLGGLVVVGACASDTAASKVGGSTSSGAAPVATDGATTRLAADGFDVSCCERAEFDLNRDGKPDTYQFSKVVKDERVVVRKENDVNFDGRIDLVRSLSDEGIVEQERLDNDFDGRVDLVIVFERGVIVRKEYDTNFDQGVDLWRFFEKGTIAREEADLNYDGKVDYWEYFEGGKLDRVGIDRNADGNVDEWMTGGEG